MGHEDYSKVFVEHFLDYITDIDQRELVNFEKTHILGKCEFKYTPRNVMNVYKFIML